MWRLCWVLHFCQPTLCRGETAAKNRAFFGTLWEAFMAANLYCSSSLCLQNWLCLSLQVPEKAAELLTGPLQFLGQEGFRLQGHWLGLSHHNFLFCCFLGAIDHFITKCVKAFCILQIWRACCAQFKHKLLKILSTNPTSSAYCSEVLSSPLKILIVLCVSNE